MNSCHYHNDIEFSVFARTRIYTTRTNRVVAQLVISYYLYYRLGVLL